MSNKLARFAVSNLSHATSVTSPPSATGVQWGTWVQQSGGYTYIYGTEDLGLAKYAKVVRVSGTSLTGTWRYWNGSTWVLGESSAIRLPPGTTTYGVSNEYSVHRIGTQNLWVLITHDSGTPADLYADVMSYRPRSITVNLNGVS